jgi:hypothetical protein
LLIENSYLIIYQTLFILLELKKGVRLKKLTYLYSFTQLIIEFVYPRNAINLNFSREAKLRFCRLWSSNISIYIYDKLFEKIDATLLVRDLVQITKNNFM